MKSVSVIIPTYNRIESLLLSINSVLNQTYSSLELIIVDDGSTDKTEELVLQINDPRVRYHKCEKNHGVSHARNLGVELASNDIIAFNDSDDIWHIDKLERQQKYMDEHPESMLVYCPFMRSFQNTVMRIPPADRLLDELGGNIYRSILFDNTIGPPTVLLTKDNYYKIGGYDETFPALEDWDFAIEASKLGPIGYLDEVLVDVSTSASGVSAQIGNYFTARCMLLKKNYHDICSLELQEAITIDILTRAEKLNVLEPVKKMLMLYLANIDSV